MFGMHWPEASGLALAVGHRHAYAEHAVRASSASRGRTQAVGAMAAVALVATFVVLSSAPSFAASANAAAVNCSDFSTQASAQSYFISRGGPASDPEGLDADSDGIACESNPCPCNYSTTPPPPTPPTPPPTGDPVPAPPSCDPGVPPSVRFYGLASRVRIGRRETFGFTETLASPDWEAVRPVEVQMVDSDGEVFFSDTVGRFDSEVLYVQLDLGDRPVEIRGSYFEQTFAGSTCARTIVRSVAGLRRVYFPSRCYNFRERPARVVVACGDGNFQLRGVRWRRWTQPVARGRGVALLNDCIPYCAEGTFHRLRVRARLSGRRLCGNVERYMYTRIAWRFARKPSWLSRKAGRAPFPCRLYDN